MNLKMLLNNSISNNLKTYEIKSLSQLNNLEKIRNESKLKISIL